METFLLSIALFSRVWHMNPFCHGRCHSLAVMGLMRYPSANLPPSEPIIWLFIWSAELTAVWAGRCWLWTDVETWTSSPRPWTPRSFKQRCVVLRRSDTQWSPPTGFTKQQRGTSSTRAWWDLEITGSRSPGGGYNSITRHTSRQAGWQQCFPLAGRCACASICGPLHCIIKKKTLSLFVTCHITHSTMLSEIQPLHLTHPISVQCSARGTARS